MKSSIRKKTFLRSASILLITMATTFTAIAEDRQPSSEDRLPTHDELQAQLKDVVGSAINGGAGLDFWGIIVDRDGIVRTVAFSGKSRDSQLPIGRIVTTAKASTVNNLGLNNFVVSTPQLSQAVLPNGLFQNLPNAYPINPLALQGPSKLWGTSKDPMIGLAIGGATALGGGLALYNSKGQIIGGLGIGGEVHPCADHNAAWILRHRLGLDNLPAGVGFSPTGDDNIIYDLNDKGVSASGFGTRECSPEATAISRRLPTDFPITRH